MSTTDQLKDNMSYMKDFKPLDEKERKALKQVVSVFRKTKMIPCTACHYCVEENHCPKDIRIPDLFACMNAKDVFHDWNMNFYYNNVLTAGENGSASDCIKCGGCERVCPQHLPIRKLLTEVVSEFEA